MKNASSVDTIILNTNGNTYFNGGNVGIGTNAPASTLTVLGPNDATGGITLTSTETDTSNKIGRIKNAHYTNAEEPFTFVQTRSEVSDSIINLGGSSGVENAATRIGFWTSVNNTTLTGTEVMRINSAQNVGIGETSAMFADYKLQVRDDNNGDSNPLLISNKDFSVGTTQSVAINFGLSRDSGTHKPQAGRIRVGREGNTWDADDANIDSYMDFSVYQSNALSTKLTIASDGNATFAGDVIVSGDLFVTGASTSVNVEDLNVEQGEITLNFGAGDTSAAANGAGIRIQDAVDASTDATILWNTTSDKFEFSHGIISAGPITGSNLSGTNTGDETQASINALDITEVGTITSGVWNGSVITSAYLDADTAHLTTTQTFTGQKNFNSSGGTIPLNISRSGGSASQVLSIGVTDTSAVFNYIEDTSEEGTGAYGNYLFQVSGNEVTSPTVTALALDENVAKFAGTIYTRGATSLTPDATQSGAIILAKGGSEASPSTDGRGIEFLTADANDGYGHRLVSFDNTNGDTPLILQRRNNNAAWTTQVTFEGNSNNATFAGNVGIGTTSPEKHLSIGSSQAEGIQFTFDTTNDYRNQILNYWNSSADSRMDFNIARTSGATPSTIMSVGYNSNVGIGTTTPASTLDLTNGTDTAERAIRIQNDTVVLLTGVEGSAGNRFVGSAVGNAFFGTTSAHGLELGTNNNVRMTIDSAGAISSSSSSASPVTITSTQTAIDGIRIGGTAQTDYTNLVWYAEGGDGQIFRGSSTYTNWGGANALNIYNSNGNIAFHPSATTNVLTITSTGANLVGTFTATSKSFDIEHPTKEGMRLRYGSLEGPENGVYVRGRMDGEQVIQLPDYWLGLVHEDTITVNLTSIGPGSVWVESIENNTITVGGSEKFFYHVFAERKDIEKLTVEYDV